MNDPIKIIFRFKNNNKRIQHNMYIFIGEVPKNIISILNKIKELSLYNTFITLSKIEYDRLVKFYGDDWYRKFFNTYHINFTVHIIRKSTQQQKEIIKKYGKSWYNMHIEEHKISMDKIYYTYEALIKDEILRREMRKRKIKIKDDEERMVNYVTQKKREITDVSKIETKRITPEEMEDSSIKENTYDMLRQHDYNSLSSISSLPGGLLSSDDNNTDSYIKEIAMLRQHDYNSSSSISSLPGGLLSSNSDNSIDREREINRDLGRLVEQINRSIKNKYGQYGGDMADTTEAMSTVSTDLVQPDPLKPGDDDRDGMVEFEEGLESHEILKDEDMNLEEIEKLYQDMDVDVDKNTIKTSELIKKALRDEKILKKTKTKMVEFDTSKDRLLHDEQLKNDVMKHYITSQYIFKDDTIKMIKNKICCSIKNNSMFGKNTYLLPSRQYLWSEYYFSNKIEKVMVGQKWIKRTNLLHIDVEPNNNFRQYEELRDNLKLLRDNIKRYGSKIKREDDDFNILYDYDKYYTNNEIYLRDVYSEFGKGYSPSPEVLKNIMDVYIRIYFPKINQDDVKNIVSYVNGDDQIEGNKIRTIYENINNDLIIENQIMKNVEDTKKNPEYKDIFKGNYITQSVIHVGLHLLKNTKINLFRIFNEFITTNTYPFIQYQKADGHIIFKYNKKDIFNYASKKENIDVLSKWFENASYGISFKVKIVEKNITKFMAINLNETGRIEYKTQWKEEDMATIKDIKNTYNYVKDLVIKLNKEKNKVKIEIPQNNEFKYAFINTIQNFELPEKFIINHNDLSEFSRYFYPYIALVIAPRKRRAKIKKEEEVSKYGTYLRYKRVSKYENIARIEQRILYFMRNYEYNDQSLANEISKQFNSTLEKAIHEIERVRKKYPKIKRSRKILKRLENIPKYKPPGIGIDIQGKSRTRYKIRISGVRTKEQLDRIITFMNILIYLYVETYLYKRPERKVLKETLKKLTNIARRRNKVADIVNYEKDYKTIKHMTQFDKKRIGFKPEKGQNQWTRSCQNSGKDKRRRPQQYISEFDLRKKKFRFNKKTSIYERKVIIKKGRKKSEVTIRAVGLKSTTDDGAEGTMIYYTCDPDNNGDHIHIGFLSRSNNPHGQCMPCCFKKDMMLSKNKEKSDYFMKCIGEIMVKKKEKGKIVGDILYILQDTNKIQKGRIGFLPKYLDLFF